MHLDIIRTDKYYADSRLGAIMPHRQVEVISSEIKSVAQTNVWPMQLRLSRQRGATLAVVLALTAMLQLLAIAQADTALIALRTAGARWDRLIAFDAADSGLVLCSRLLERGAAPVRPWSEPGEPAYWRSGHAFGGSAPAAFALQANWPGAAAAPQCLIESRPMDGLARGQPERLSYLLTVRGLGARPGTQSYVQAIAWDADAKKTSGGAPQLRGWRSVAAAPDGF